MAQFITAMKIISFMRRSNLFAALFSYYEGNSVNSLRKAFEGAVDDYLDLCAKEGKIPDKPFKGSFNVRTGTPRAVPSGRFAGA